MSEIFKKLGISPSPIFLAPLAGITDSPFRRVCNQFGADLSYVEMISASALIYESSRTLRMMVRESEESILGVQLVGKAVDDIAKAVEILHGYSFETIDINMGCPVKKVVKNGGGSGMLKDPEKVFASVKKAREATDKPLSVKIRVGWDRDSVNFLEVSEAIEKAGADWITVHGRTRSEGYSTKVNLDDIARVKHERNIPVLGNGNIFHPRDAAYMKECTGVDGYMLARGVLGNPWLFKAIKTGKNIVTLDEWYECVDQHLKWQEKVYDNNHSAILMRKHLLWYVKGWPNARHARDRINRTTSIDDARSIIEDFATILRNEGVSQRVELGIEALEDRYIYEGL